MDHPVGADGRAHLRGIGLIVTAFALFSVTDALMKHLSGLYALPQTVFFTTLFGMIPILGLAFWQGGLRTLATRRPGVQVLRSVFGVSAGYFTFYAFTRMPIADVYAILFTAPLIIAALSALLFRERIDGRRWAAILAGFAGVLTMLRPTGDIIDPGALAAFASALCFAGSALVLRHLGRDETAPSFPFYGNLLAIVVLLPVLPFVFVLPGPADFALMAASGLTSGTALCCLLTAFRIAPGPVVAPFQYTQMVWGVLFGWLVFGDVPGPRLLAGGAVVIAAGLYLLRREASAARASAPGPA